MVNTEVFDAIEALEQALKGQYERTGGHSLLIMMTSHGYERRMVIGRGGIVQLPAWMTERTAVRRFRQQVAADRDQAVLKALIEREEAAGNQVVIMEAGEGKCEVTVDPKSNHEEHEGREGTNKAGYT
jgi:hypothetical protein